MRSKGRLEWIPVARNNYVEKRRRRSEETKRRIADALRGEKQGPNEIIVDPEDAAELHSKIRQGGKFRHQALIDWWEDLKRLP